MGLRESYYYTYVYLGENPRREENLSPSCTGGFPSFHPRPLLLYAALDFSIPVIC